MHWLAFGLWLQVDEVCVARLALVLSGIFFSNGLSHGIMSFTAEHISSLMIFIRIFFTTSSVGCLRIESSTLNHNARTALKDISVIPSQRTLGTKTHCTELARSEQRSSLRRVWEKLVNYPLSPFIQFPNQTWISPCFCAKFSGQVKIGTVTPYCRNYPLSPFKSPKRKGHNPSSGPRSSSSASIAPNIPAKYGQES